MFWILAAGATLSATAVVLPPFGRNPIHGAMALISTFFCLAGLYVLLAAHLVAALQVIVYAGAIMVLFVFVVMMLNLGNETIAQERAWLKPRAWAGPTLLAALLLGALLRAIAGATGGAGATEVGPKAVGIALFGPYVLAVELASLLLLGALVAAYHLGRDDHR